MAPPTTGRSHTGTPLRRNHDSTNVTPRIIAIPPSAHAMPSARTGR